MSDVISAVSDAPIFVRALHNVDCPAVPWIAATTSPVTSLTIGTRITVCAINRSTKRWRFGIIKKVKWLELNWVIFEVVAESRDYGTYIPDELFLIGVHISSTHLPRHLRIKYSIQNRFNRLPIKIARIYENPPILSWDEKFNNQPPRFLHSHAS